MSDVILRARNTDPHAIKSLEDFVNRALHHDWYYHFSDDHRAYSAGRAAHDRIVAYAAENKLAGELWGMICKAHNNDFMAGQLSDHIDRLVLCEAEEVPEAVAALRAFCLGYLASTGADSLLGNSLRNAIAVKIGAPPRWDPDVQDERNAAIDLWLEEQGS